MKCELPYWPAESWWGTAGVFGSCVAEICVKETQNILINFHWWLFYCHLHQGILLKRGGSSLNKEWKKKYVTLSSDGILSYHSSVNVSQCINGALWKHFAVEKTTDSSCVIVTAVWLVRTTCWTSPGKRWTCCEWQWRCLGKDHLVLYRPVAFQLDSMDGSKMCQDLKVSAEVIESSWTACCPLALALACWASAFRLLCGFALFQERWLTRYNQFLILPDMQLKCTSPMN